MVNVAKNRELTAQLKELYERVQPAFLDEHEKAFGHRDPRINEYGIISEEDYNADNGILILLKEGNDWAEKDYQDGYVFRDFAHFVMTGKWINHDGKLWFNPTPWYNLGRWLAAIKEPQKPAKEIAEMYLDAVHCLSAAAITNVNKANGYAASGKEFVKVAQSEIAVRTLKEEIEILKPKMIIFGSTAWVLEESYRNQLREQGCILLEMCHPGAYISKTKMIEELRKQLKAQQAES